jgi:hypothetical protein
LSWPVFFRIVRTYIHSKHILQEWCIHCHLVLVPNIHIGNTIFSETVPFLSLGLNSWRIQNNGLSPLPPPNPGPRSSAEEWGVGCLQDSKHWDHLPGGGLLWGRRLPGKTWGLCLHAWHIIPVCTSQLGLWEDLFSKAREKGEASLWDCFREAHLGFWPWSANLLLSLLSLSDWQPLVPLLMRWFGSCGDTRLPHPLLVAKSLACSQLHLWHGQCVYPVEGHAPPHLASCICCSYPLALDSRQCSRLAGVCKLAHA